MSFALLSPPDVLRNRFLALQRPEDIAALLEVKYSDLVYWIYRTPSQRRYTAFQIRKKSGAPREIEAPSMNTRILQQKLNQVLQAVYQPKRCVHGFVPGRSVKTNALQHIGRRYLLNIDLSDFFPSINFGRVRGMFMAKPYNLPQKVATVLAHLCCFNRRLPQGAPTSPVVSNMICAQMDSQLQRLAATNRCMYTRYTDDMSFSTWQRSFPSALAVVNDLNQVEPGIALREIIRNNGFSIHPQKIWLRRQDRRQEVTGVTVNVRPNLPRRYTNQIRAILHAWEKYGLEAAQADFEAKYDQKHRSPWTRTPPFQYVVKGKIEYLGMIKSQESLTYLRFLDWLGRLAPDLTGGRGTPRGLLLRRYEALIALPDPRRRGYLLQDILRDTFDHFAISVEQSFTRNEGGEQIDGAFLINGWHYIVECRWRAKVADGRQVDGLLGQVIRSGDQTMGVFFSVNGWSENVPQLLKQNPRKVIILMDGRDFHAVLAGKITMPEILEAKIRELNFRSEPFISVEKLIPKERT
jgi:RNA-directed DNA polymerase